MKNILLLASIYPVNREGYVGTNICHYFAKEWVKMGYNVKVLFFWSTFPKPYYWITRPFVSKLRAKTSFAFPTFTFYKTEIYFKDGVEVILLPVQKILPHEAPSDKKMLSLLGEGVEILEKRHFVPDVITAHFLNPQLKALHLIKLFYPDIKKCLVFHRWDKERMQNVYGEKYEDYLKSIDLLGFRSSIQRNLFLKSSSLEKKTCICYSGVPQEYISNRNRTFNKSIRKFVFLGRLYKLKKVDISFKALIRAYPQKDFQFDVIGDGGEMKKLKALANELGINKQVIFHGHLMREEAQDILAKSECFVMVSSPEVLGLVYLEAMSHGLITIGSKGEGIDGLLINGQNGFLVTPGNVEELANTFIKIKEMPLSQLESISSKAKETANENTDLKAAENYANMLFNIE